jgi:PAS domain S-box-containing protein
MALTLFVTLLGAAYGFLYYLEQQRENSIIAREVDRFAYKIQAVNRAYYGLGEFAYEFLISNSQNRESLEALMDAQKEGSEAFLNKATSSFMGLQSILKSLHVDFIHFHTQDAKSFLRLGQKGGYGDSMSIFRSDISTVQSTNKSLQSYEIGKNGLLLRNIFPLNDYGEIKSVEFSTPLFYVFNSLAEFDKAHYGAYIPKASRTLLGEPMEESKYLDGWIFVDSLGCDESQLMPLSLEKKEALLGAMKLGNSYGASFTHGGEIYFFGATPLHSTITNEAVAYAMKISNSDELIAIQGFYNRYFIMATFFIGMFVFFSYWGWQQKERVQALYDNLAIQKSDTEALIDHAEAGIASIDKDGRILQANEMFAKLVGVRRELVVYHNFFTILGPEQTSKMRDFMLDKSRGSFVHRFQNLTKKWIEVDTLVSKQSKQETMTLVATSREEKRALERALKRLNLYFNHSDLGYMILDDASNIVDTNETIFDITGYTKKELVGQNAQILFVTQKLFETWQKNYAIKPTDNKISSIEYKLRKKNGAIFWVEMFGNSFEDGDSEQSIWSMRDISVRVNSRNVIRKLNDRLQAQFSELEAILDVIPMPIFIKDANFRYKGCNKTFCEFFHYEKEDIVGKSVNDLFPGSFCQLVNEQDNQMLKSSYQNYQTAFADPVTKERKILEFHKKSIFKDGDFDGFVGVVIDVTQKEKQKAMLEAQIKEEVEKNIRNLELHQEERIKDVKFSSIGRMAAGITHEINTPLTYVKGNAEMLQMDIEKIQENDLRQSMKADMEVILEGLNRIANIIESMRQAAQVSSEEAEEINLYETLVNALILSHNRAKQIVKIYLNDIVFDLDLPKDGEVIKHKAQRQRIEQVWIILLSNAFDVLEKIEPFEKRALHVKIWEDSTGVLVRFSDNGGGIHPDILSRIFEPFMSTKTSSGIGIGLNIAQKIVEDQGGKISAFNDSSGAVFEIFLPKKGDNNG